MELSVACKTATKAAEGKLCFILLFYLPAEPVDKVAAVREFRVLHTALHSSPAYRDAVSAVSRFAIWVSFVCPLSVKRGPKQSRVVVTLLIYSHFFWQVFKMLGNKESLDQIIVATPGLSSDPVALGESRGSEGSQIKIVSV